MFLLAAASASASVIGCTAGDACANAAACSKMTRLVLMSRWKYRLWVILIVSVCTSLYLTNT
ncbi:MAG: hypothetical protein RLY82_1009 [Pseudomonadota bacterium]|jgi:hypothetical protein